MPPADAQGSVPVGGFNHSASLRSAPPLQGRLGRTTQPESLPFRGGEPPQGGGGVTTE